MNENDEKRQVDEFILQEIETVPHLEALLLLWNSRPKQWQVEDMAKELFLPEIEARSILQDLSRRGLVIVTATQPETYAFESEPEKDRLIDLVDRTYRRDLIRLSRLIHSKPAAGIREFARAFRFKKERE